VRPERFDMHVDGKGKAGFVSGIANVAFDEIDGGTLMRYRADLQVGGRVASVGQRLLDSVGKTMSQRGLETVNRSLNARLAPVEGGAVAAGGRPAARAAPGTSLASDASLPTSGRKRKTLLLVLAIIAAALLALAL